MQMANVETLLVRLSKDCVFFTRRIVRDGIFISLYRVCCVVGAFASLFENVEKALKKQYLKNPARS